VTLQDITTATSYKVYTGGSDSYLRIGANAWAVTLMSDNRTIVVDLNGNGATNTSNTVDIYTKSGAVINPRDVGSNYALATITETPLYTISGSNEPTGQNLAFNATYAASTYVSFAVNASVSAYGGQVSTTNVYKYITAYGTYVEHDTDADTLKVYYAGNRPSYANAGVGSDPKFTTTGGATVETAIKITAPVAKLATEVSTTALTADLILVGGPCANSLVATLMADDNVTCSNWAYTTGVIKEYTNAFGSGKKALVVAGTNADDTRSLAAKVMKGTLSFSA
jgi:hypothetical protein